MSATTSLGTSQRNSLLSNTSSHMDTTKTPNDDSKHSRHTSLSDATIHSIISASIMEGKEDYTHHESGQRDTTASTTQAVVANGATTKGRTRPTLPILLAFIALCLSIFLVALDTVLIPTALPAISLSFHISDSLYVWIGSAYLLANAASVPFWGKLSDIFGRKPVILAANFIFLLGSIVCAVSVNARMLVAGRVVQGFGGGGVVVLVHVCVSDLFSIRYVLLSLFPSLTSEHCRFALPIDVLLIVQQRPIVLHRYSRRGVGCCLSAGSSTRWHICRVCELEVVLLYQPYVSSYPSLKIPGTGMSADTYTNFKKYP
jgi:hypothetical protein